MSRCVAQLTQDGSFAEDEWARDFRNGYALHRAARTLAREHWT